MLTLNNGKLTLKNGTCCCLPPLTEQCPNCTPYDGSTPNLIEFIKLTIAGVGNNACDNCGIFNREFTIKFGLFGPAYPFLFLPPSVAANYDTYPFGCGWTLFPFDDPTNVSPCPTLCGFPEIMVSFRMGFDGKVLLMVQWTVFTAYTGGPADYVVWWHEFPSIPTCSDVWNFGQFDNVYNNLTTSYCTYSSATCTIAPA